MKVAVISKNKFEGNLPILSLSLFVDKAFIWENIIHDGDLRKVTVLGKKK